MKKKELRARIAELECEIKRLELELHVARLTPPTVVPTQPERVPWQGDMVPWVPWQDGVLVYPYETERTSSGAGITWIQPHATCGPIHIYGNGEA